MIGQAFMKIGLCGGTFNPPHIGHTELALDFYENSNPDLLIIVPSFIPPHKAASSVAAFHRFNMAKLAFLALGEQGINYFVSDYEISRNDVSYTINTVNHFITNYNVSSVDLCIGSDMLLSFETWKNAEELMKKCHIFSKARHRDEMEKLSDFSSYLKKRYDANVTIMPGKVCDVSSTQIRSFSTSGHFSEIDARVAKYIKANGLYRQ